MPATYTIAIDWANDGSFAETGDDISARVLARAALAIQYGRDQARSLSPMGPGRAALEVDNTSRDYSPENASSPLAGDLLPGRPVRITATLGANTYNLFQGHLDDFAVQPNRTDRSVQFSALDAMAKLSAATISTPLLRRVTTGQAMHAILDAAGWPAGARDIDNGATQLAWWWEDGTDAYTAAQKLVAAEGPSARVNVDSLGRVVFRDRHHRLTRTASKTVQATLRDTGAEPLFSAPFVYDVGWRDIVNDIAINVEERAASPVSEIVWESDQTYVVPFGTVVEFNVVTQDPFLDAAIETDGVPLGNQPSRNTGQSLSVVLRGPLGGTDPPLVYTNLQVRARPVRVARTVQVAGADTGSIADYGQRSYGQDVNWLSVGDAQALVDLILAARAHRSPIVTIRLDGSNDTRLTQQLDRDLSDRIHVVEAETGLDADCFLEQIQHTISDGGLSTETLFGLEKVGNQLDDPATVFILNSATNGVLGTNLLAH